MQKRRLLSHRSALLPVIAAAIFLLLPACTFHKEEDGKGKKVDIEMPFAGVHVRTEADPKDTGMSVYPGARRLAGDNDRERHSANVDISGFGFGVKVVAIKYQSDDPPDKLISYYRRELEKYGKTLECRTSRKHTATVHKHKNGSNELTCDQDNHGETVELKVGTEDRQHLVAVTPKGVGSEFALVYINMTGKEETL